MKKLLPGLIVPVLLVAAPLSAAEMPCARGWSAHESGVVAPRAEALGLDQIIRSSLEEMRATPGLAVGILDDGEVIYARGFGVRDLDSCSPVTPETPFYLASVTKSFTGMLAALLQQEGTLELDQPLSHHFPGLTLPPPLNPAQTSLRDLLNHRSGFSNGAINFRTFLPGDLDDAELLEILAKYSKPQPITFEYTNTGYLIAAVAMKQATGRTWRELLEERIFEPLGMASTSTSVERAGEFARPYGIGLDGNFELAMVKVQEQMHAAGGVNSNVVDLLRWAEANLTRGAIDGEQVLPPGVVRQAHAPQIQYTWPYGRYRRFAYGLGVHNSDLDGELILHHFGGPAHFSFAPERGLGLVLLSSGSDSTGFVHELGAYLYDLLLEREKAATDFERSVREARSKLDERHSRRRKRDAEIVARLAELSRPASAYAGGYSSDRMGTMTVTQDGAGLKLHYGVLEIDLEPLEKDAFLARFPEAGPMILAFDHWQDERPGVLDWGGRIFERKE